MPVLAWEQLRPPLDIDGPRIRLGLVWAAVSLAAVLAGPLPTAVVFAGVALGAAGQACRSWRRLRSQPDRRVAIGGATVIALAGGVAPWAVAVAAALTAAAAAGARFAPATLGGPTSRRSDPRTTAAIALLIGAGGAAPAVVRDQLGATAALVLVVLVHAVDASTFIVGSGARSPWEGWAAGAAAAGAVSLAVAALLVPPFRGAAPWLLALVVAVLVPAGGVVATAVLGRPQARAPALRRIDAFLVAAPVWALVASLVLDL
ncbi:MAG: hypothetical protein KY439_04430 [Actinobacteria bacterium]|nr:hypothetical protein [Actinomycetota bacterium]